MPDGTKPLPEPMLTYHQWSFVAFTWRWFHKKCSWMNLICNMCLKITLDKFDLSVWIWRSIINDKSHCGYWGPGALAPGHEWLQCWLCTRGSCVFHRFKSDSSVHCSQKGGTDLGKSYGTSYKHILQTQSLIQKMRDGVINLTNLALFWQPISCQFSEVVTRMTPLFVEWVVSV